MPRWFENPPKSHNLGGRPAEPRARARRPVRRGRKRRVVLLSAILLPALAAPLLAWGGKVKIRRKFSPGAAIVYAVHTDTQSKLETQPKGLDAFLPPIPTGLETDAENAMTVSRVEPGGDAEIESRFERFDIQSHLPENMTEANRKTFLDGQEEIARSLRGRSFSLRYGRDGKLADVRGAEELLQQFPEEFRGPLTQAFKYLLGQITGEGLYPDHPVARGEEWERKLETPAASALPFDAKGISKMRFTGKTKHGGIQAAMVEYSFNDTLTPRLDQLPDFSPLAALSAQGLKLDVEIEGKGEGRALVALDDGRVLQNHATLQQVLTAHLNPAHPAATPADPITLKLTTDTTVEVAGKEPKR